MSKSLICVNISQVSDGIELNRLLAYILGNKANYEQVICVDSAKYELGANTDYFDLFMAKVGSDATSFNNFSLGLTYDILGYCDSGFVKSLFDMTLYGGLKVSLLGDLLIYPDGYDPFTFYRMVTAVPNCTFVGAPPMVQQMQKGLGTSSVGFKQEDFEVKVRTIVQDVLLERLPSIVAGIMSGMQPVSYGLGASTGQTLPQPSFSPSTSGQEGYGGENGLEVHSGAPRGTPRAMKDAPKVEEVTLEVKEDASMGAKDNVIAMLSIEPSADVPVTSEVKVVKKSKAKAPKAAAEDSFNKLLRGLDF